MGKSRTLCRWNKKRYTKCVLKLRHLRRVGGFHAALPPQTRRLLQWNGMSRRWWNPKRLLSLPVLSRLGLPTNSALATLLQQRCTHVAVLDLRPQSLEDESIT